MFEQSFQFRKDGQKVFPELRCKRRKGERQTNVTGRRILGGGYSICKGPETGVLLLKETSVVEESEPRDRCRMQVKEVGEQGAHFEKICKSLQAFTLRWKATGETTYFMI